MDDYIFKANIKRFEQQLKDSSDKSQRKVLKTLLAAERQRLERARALA
jgi:hypothetical protein